MSATATDPTSPSQNTLRFFALVAVLFAAFYAYLAIDVAGTPICGEAQQGEECFEKSATTKTLLTVATALTALAALATAGAALRCARGRLSYGTVRGAAIVTAILAAIAIIL